MNVLFTAYCFSNCYNSYLFFFCLVAFSLKRSSGSQEECNLVEVEKAVSVELTE